MFKILKSLDFSNQLWIFIIGINFIRLLIVFVMGPMPQDMYYYFYTQHPDWAYFDHPAGIMVLLKLFTAIFGKSVLSIKMANFICSIFTQFFLFKGARLFMNLRKSIIVLLLFNSSLLATIVSINSTPDVPLLLFWSIALFALGKALFRQENLYWIVAGLAMGAAFNCKYTAVALPLGLIGLLLFSNRFRPLLKTIYPYIGLLITLIGYTPVFYWNIQHEFASFLFQSAGRAKGLKLNLLNPIGTLASQFALLGPVLFIILQLMIINGFKLIRRRFPNNEVLFFMAFSLPVVGGFLLISLTQWVKINWLMPGYLAAIFWYVYYHGDKWLKPQLVFHAILHVLLLIQMISYVVPVKSDDTWLGWPELAQEVALLENRYPDYFVFSSDGYKTTAALSFFNDKKYYGENILGRPGLQFDYIGDDLGRLEAKNALFIDSNTQFNSIYKEETFTAELHKVFNEVIRLDPIIFYKNGKAVRKWSVYECKKYVPLQLPD